MNGDEFLQTSHLPEALHGTFSSSKRQIRILGSVVKPSPGFLSVRVSNGLHRRAIRPKFVRHYSKRWAMALHMTTDMKRNLAIRALNMAIAFRAPPRGCIHHMDRGSQYCSHDYQKILRQHGFKASMSGKGNCYDNAAVETFFKTIKAELIWRRSWETRRQAEMAIFHSHGLQANHCRAVEYINGFDNPRRRHSAPGWKSPVAFERKVA